ncbi:MAG TPA: hypothetical protein V6D47_05685 [Oscillatoriaceae cyanobacterium]
MRKAYAAMFAVSLLAAQPSALANAPPGAVQMQGQMVTGQGRVAFVRQGNDVRIELTAERLPAPGSYEIWLSAVVGSAPEVAHEQLASLRVFGGRLHLMYVVPTSELAKWHYLQLVHLPTGSLTNEREAHPALSAPIPNAAKRA